MGEETASIWDKFLKEKSFARNVRRKYSYLVSIGMMHLILGIILLISILTLPYFECEHIER